ncbi:Hsp20/alpha crystallin family protein [Effusibacillus consociatus]|uniref:Hsp20/alpha crystallin family protein n=1 Tax=Effusibacillus consociatus TaxID=1117041 RepID=A0ABV9Q6D3_9BACL
MNNNPFDSLRQLGQLGEQLQKMFGEDFMKSVMGSNTSLPNMPGFQSAVSGANGQHFPSDPFQNVFNWSGGNYPRLDLYQTRNEVVAVLELPGLEKSSDVKVYVEPNKLVVKGNQSRRYSGIAKEQFLISERRNSFEREIALPVKVLARKARAYYRHGLLEVHLIKDGGSKAEPSGNSIPIDFE